MELINIENLTIKKNENYLLKNFNLLVNEKEKIGIFAPTGSGKSTLLNYIANVLPEQNDFQISGELHNIQNLKISYVFQDLRLLEHLTVFENVFMPLKNIYQKEKAQKIATEILDQFFLGEKKNQKVLKLSGGEKQRVALARAFSFPCNLLLLDEPFHSQDEHKKEFFINFTKKFIEEKKIALILISHDRTELEFLCEKIIEEKMFCCK